MKRKIIFGIMILVLSSFIYALPDGDGSQLNPYNITTCAELNESNTLNLSGNFQVLNDIECAGFDFGDELFVTFYGNFTGNNNSIDNITMSDTGQYGMTFIRTLRGGKLEDVTFRTIDVEGDNVMGIVGQCYEPSIKPCIIRNVIVDGDIIGGDNEVGGIVGKIFHGATIENVYFNGTINGQSKTGGIIGLAQNNVYLNNAGSSGRINPNNPSSSGGLIGQCDGLCRINNSYSTMYLTGTSSSTQSGLVGRGSGTYGSNTYIENSYFAGTFENNYNEWAVLFGNYSYNTNSLNNFFDNQTTGIYVNTQGTGLTTAEFKNQTIFESANWNFDDIWVMRDKSPYPQFQWIPETVELMSGLTILQPSAHENVSGTYLFNWTITDVDSQLSYFRVELRNLDTGFYIYNDSTTQTNMSIDTTPFENSDNTWIFLTAFDINNNTLQTEENFNIANPVITYSNISNCSQWINRNLSQRYYVMTNNLNCENETITQRLSSYNLSALNCNGSIISNIYFNNISGLYHRGMNISNCIFKNSYGLVDNYALTSQTGEAGFLYEDGFAHFNYRSENISFINVTLKSIEYLSQGQGLYMGRTYDQSKKFININAYNSKVISNKDNLSSYVGGLFGSTGKTTYSNCSFHNGIVENGNSYLGGIAGSCIGTSLIDVYSTGEIRSNSSIRLGGLCGQLQTNDIKTVRHTFSAMKMNSDGGGLFGRLYPINTTYEDNYFDANISGVSSACQIGCSYEGNSTEEMYQQNTFKDFDFTNTWAIKEDSYYPYFQNTPLINNPVANDITNPLNDTYHHGTINIEWNEFYDADDDIIGYTVKLYNESGFIADITTLTLNTFVSYNTQIYADGLFRVDVVAIDSRGFNATSEVYFSTDNTAPIVNIVITESSNNISGTCLDSSALFNLQTNETGFTNTGSFSNFVLTRSTSFIGWLEVNCTDVQENTGSDSAFIQYDVDAPTCSGIGDLNLYLGDALNITANCSDEINLTLFNVTCTGLNYSYQIVPSENFIIHNIQDSNISISSFTCAYFVSDAYRNITYYQSIHVTTISPMFEAGECPQTQSQATIFMGIIFMALAFIAGGLVIGFGFFTFVGALILMIASWTMAGCSVAMFIVMGGASVVIMAYAFFGQTENFLGKIN